MKKLILIPLLLLLTSCDVEKADAKVNIQYLQDYYRYEFIVDKETCGEYILDKGISMTPRLNADGTLKLNETCLEEK